MKPVVWGVVGGILLAFFGGIALTFATGNIVWLISSLVAFCIMMAG